MAASHDRVGPDHSPAPRAALMTAGDHVALLHRAIALAGEARARGDHPFGALLADRAGTVLLEARNSVVTGRDVTAHAETNLVRDAGAAYDPGALAESVLYTSTEPCAMCAGAIYWAGIGTVVFALAEAALRTLTGDDPQNPTLALPCRTVFAAGQRETEVVGPIELPEARAVHAGFWRPGSGSDPPGMGN